jgi:competence protein ComEC
MHLIKRPLVWILIAYLTGVYLAWQKFSFLLVCSIILLIFLIIYLLMFRCRKKIINRKDNFLWCLPFLLLIGFLAMKGQLKQPELYDAFDQKLYCELRGEISMIVEKPERPRCT